MIDHKIGCYGGADHEINKMKKVYSISADVKSSDSLETTRRLYKNITEIAKKLEEQKSRALTVIDIFTPTGEALRSKLRDYCERLMINDPLNHVQKTEELLWRRGFYDIFSMAKKLRKGNFWNEMEKAYLSAHLSVGVGFYHHLILRLQLEYDLSLTGVIDFAYPPNQKGEKPISLKAQNAETKKSIFHFIHRSLICLGDLARYQLDLDPHWDPQIATRYYKMAIAMDNKYGMPHNQLGTVAGNKNYGLDAVYHYMRSTLCTEAFEGAEGNLKRTVVIHSISGKEKCLTQFCVARLLTLLQLWDNNSVNIDQINQESQTLVNDIENCLNVEKSETIDQKSAENEDSIEKYLLTYKNDETIYLTEDMIFKMIVICFMKIYKIAEKEPSEIHGVVAFVLAVFSQILQFVVMRLQESLLDISMVNKNYELEKIDDNEKILDNEQGNVKNEESVDKIILDDKDSSNNSDDVKPEVNGNHINGKTKKSKEKSQNLLKKLRRPRNRKNSSDSEASDGEGINSASSSDDLNSDISETDEDFLSDEHALSDDALSDDMTDDEKTPSKEKNSKKCDNDKNEINGCKKTDNEEKIIEENENEDENKTTEANENNEDNDDKEIKNDSTNSKNVLDENSTSATTLTYVAQKEKQKLDPIKILKVLNDEKMLISIKICCDWLQGHPDIIRSCAKGSKILLKRLTTLFNLINLDGDETLKQCDKDFEIFSSSLKAKEVVDIVPLPEDIDLSGLKIFEDAQNNLDWKILRRKKMTNCEETLLRALKIVKFGHFLCSVSESGVTYDEKKSLFIFEETVVAKESPTESKNFELDQTKGKLMRHMGKLWLKAEVRALENRVHRRLISPYLVLDHDAFSKFMPVLKHLVYSKKFIVVIPSVVISALDELKRTSSRAREATRWLESQLQRGSRFLRAQRPHEKLPLPLIKAPKPKDKEAWLYFQIIECCHYLTQQSNAGASEIPVVTLLTGNDDKKIFALCPDGLANSAAHWCFLRQMEIIHQKLRLKGWYELTLRQECDTDRLLNEEDVRVESAVRAAGV